LRVLVSGGAGFIGSHLCESLLNSGHTVLALDNFLTGRHSNVATFADNPSFQLIEHDVVQPFDWPADAVFHLASPASPVGYRKYSIETLLVNSAGTYNMLELARRNNAKFIVSSTSEAYGDPLVHPQTEDYWGNVNPVGLRACYDESKRFAEAVTMEFVRKYDIDARIVRIFNTYGPRNDPDDGRVVPNFVTQALRGDPITVYGDGSQTRSFCYVSDMVEGLKSALFTENTKGGVFNLGNPDERTILEFAQVIIELCRSTSSIVYKELPPDDPTRRCPDITRARTTFGWEPRVSLEDGLLQTIEWYRLEEQG
jgi:UDP-glucuronate decarboxylase